MNTVILTDDVVLVHEDDVNIIKMYSNGKRANYIAKKLKISPRTVEGKLAALKKRHRAKTTTHLVSMFIRQKLID